MVSQYSPDDAYCAVGLLDGQVSLLSNKNQSKTMSYQVQAKTPLTSLVWTGDRQLAAGNTDGTISLLQIQEDSTNKVNLVHRMKVGEDEQILTLD